MFTTFFRAIVGIGVCLYRQSDGYLLLTKAPSSWPFLLARCGIFSGVVRPGQIIPRQITPRQITLVVPAVNQSSQLVTKFSHGFGEFAVASGNLQNHSRLIGN
jgi:hypothetical protein